MAWSLVRFRARAGEVESVASRYLDRSYVSAIIYGDQGLPMERALAPRCFCQSPVSPSVERRHKVVILRLEEFGHRTGDRKSVRKVMEEAKFLPGPCNWFGGFLGREPHLFETLDSLAEVSHRGVVSL